MAMAEVKKPRVDAVLVGFGWMGAIMGMELTEAGLKVVALEYESDDPPAKVIA